MDKKKYIVILAGIIIILSGIVFFTLKYINNKEIIEINGLTFSSKEQLIEYIKSIQDEDEKDELIIYSLQQKYITLEEADPLFVGSYLISNDGTVQNKKEHMDAIKSIQSAEDRRKMIEISLQKNLITLEEANLLY